MGIIAPETHAPVSLSHITAADEYLVHGKRSSVLKSHHDRSIYVCAKCHTAVATSEDLLSRSYRGTTGDAHLIKRVYNVDLCKEIFLEKMTTGQYLIQNYSCSQCSKVLGWRYLKADDVDQHFKQGKYILELKRVVQY